MEISDPAQPRLAWHIPNDRAHVNSRSVSVVDDYGLDSEPRGHDYLIRSDDTGTILKFQIYTSDRVGSGLFVLEYTGPKS